MDRPETRSVVHPAIADQEQLVDLDQVAAILHLTLATMYHHSPKMPTPYRAARGKRRGLWYWPEIVGWLRSYFGMPNLPDRFPIRWDRHPDR